MSNKKKRHLVFWKLLISYLIVFLIPILSGSLVYKEALKIVEEDANQINLAILEQIRDIVDRRLEEIEGLVRQVDSNNKIRSLLREPGPMEGTLPYKTYETWKGLTNLNIGNDFISDIYIYFKKPRIILSPYIASGDMTRFYNSFFQYGNMDYLEFKKKILEGNYNKQLLPSTNVIISGNKLSVIPYLQSIPVDYPEINTGLIFVLINEQQIHKLLNLSQLYIDDGGWAYIIDENQRLITKVDKGKGIKIPLSQNFTGSKGSFETKGTDTHMTVTYTVSKYNEWTYVAAIPTRLVMEKVEYIKRITSIITLIILFIGFLMAYVLAYRNTAPIRHLIKLIKDRLNPNQNIGENIYDYIEGSFEELIESKEQLQETIEQQKPILQATFFGRLLKGEYFSKEEINAYASHIGISIKSKYYVVTVTKFDRISTELSGDILKELNLKKIYIKDTLKHHIKDFGFIQDIDEDKLALILRGDAESEIKYKEIITNIVKSLKENLYRIYRIKVFFAGGGIYKRLIDINRSCDEAFQTLRHMNMKKDITWYNDLPKNDKGYYYPTDVEVRLMNLTKAGEIDEVEALLNEIFKANFIDNELSESMIRYFFYDMKCTFIKILKQLNFTSDDSMSIIESMMNKWVEFSAIDQQCDFIIRIFKEITNQVIQQQNSHNEWLKINIVQYIEDNYYDLDLCIVKVADKFNLNETYLSRFFKEHTGESFSAYLERIRMMHAREILKGTDFSIKVVATRIGYNSSNSFRRAFKRVNGLSPMAYRESAT